MCGIFGYVGKKKAIPILLDGLKKLEYRGYDSAGIFVEPRLCYKSVGEVNNLSKKVSRNIGGTAGIAHTRWATHGKPSKKNTHPHSDCSKKIWIVHNGIIENYKELKIELEKNKHKFLSDTDSEVLPHLIEEYKRKGLSLQKSIIKTLGQIVGTYGLAVMSVYEPNKIFVARKGSPLVIGIGENEYFISSDLSPILKYTKDAIFLEDKEIGVLTSSSHQIFSEKQILIKKIPEKLNQDIKFSQKGSNKHFMLKEILEQDEVVCNAMRGRIIAKDGRVKLGGLETKEIKRKLNKINKIIIVGCGSAYYAGLFGKYLLEEYTQISTEVEIGSEFKYRSKVINNKTLVLAISQSGETADTLNAIKEAKEKGALVIGITNVVGSSIARSVDAGIYNHAGQEIGVASTKAFISQLVVLILLTIFICREKNISEESTKEILKNLESLPKKIREILSQKKEIKKIASKISKFENILYLGKKYNFAIALEGALKLKEVSYIHAEGYSAGEMKHGPLALIDEKFPTIAIIPKDDMYDKMMSNIEEIKSRNGLVIAIGTKGDRKIKKLVNNVFYIPEAHEVITAILAVIPLQLLGYYAGVLRGHNVDKPRNLAKSVTVE